MITHDIFRVSLKDENVWTVENWPKSEKVKNYSIKINQYNIEAEDSLMGGPSLLKCPDLIIMKMHHWRFTTSLRMLWCEVGAGQPLPWLAAKMCRAQCNRVKWFLRRTARASGCKRCRSTEHTRSGEPGVYHRRVYSASRFCGVHNHPRQRYDSRVHSMYII